MSREVKSKKNREKKRKVRGYSLHQSIHNFASNNLKGVSLKVGLWRHRVRETESRTEERER